VLFRSGEIFKINEEYAQKISDLKVKEVEEEQKRNEAIEASRLGLASALADVFGKISGLSKEGSKAAKTFALAEIGINTAVGFVQGLRLAQQAALAAPPGAKAIVFATFAAQQIGAVLSAASQAKKILGASSSVTPPTVNGGGGGASGGANNTPTQTQTGTESNLTADLQNNAQRVYVVDSDMTAIQKMTTKAKAVSTIG
jgi:hypothetical protein